VLSTKNESWVTRDAEASRDILTFHDPYQTVVIVRRQCISLFQH